MRRTVRIALIGTGAVTLAACSTREETNGTAAAQETTPVEATVTRIETPSPTPTPTQVAAPAIQTQPGPKGASVALNRVAVTGDVLTVALTYSGGTCCSYAKIDEVSVIDDATAQRLGVLKDNAGKAMAAPISSNGKDVRIGDSRRNTAQVWFKFPAPPATTQTVSIAIPEVAPFDAVPVTR